MSYTTDMIDLVTQIKNAFVGTAEVPIDLTSCVLASTGAPLAVFADGASATPGTQITSSESWAVRWNNNATLTGIAKNIHLPSDLNTAYPLKLYYEVFKVGATLADATTITTAAFITASGALVTADADCGGVSNAVTGDATSLTLQTLTRTIAAADLAAAMPNGGPGTLKLSFGPTGGTLGTDDFVIHKAYFTYTRRAA